MPNINMKVGRKLDEQKKQEIVSKLGELITIIPGKTEASLMVEISDGVDLYLAGQKCEGIYMELKTYLSASHESKVAFTEALFEYLASIGFEKKQIYLTISGMPNWGAGGTYK